jgi:aspartokinase/homoserine dehydrogenase 1
MVTVQEENMRGIPGVASELFDRLGVRGISVTMITQSCTETSISFAIEESRVDSLMDVGNVVDIQKIGILTLVGSNMKRTVGIAARLFAILAENRINVVAISQGSTERSISVVVSRYDLVKALRTVHDGMVG